MIFLDDFSARELPVYSNLLWISIHNACVPKQMNKLLQDRSY